MARPPVPRLRQSRRRGFFEQIVELAEIRVEVPVSDLAVLDGFCSATGRCRADVLREILGMWSAQKHHEAILIVRVAGHNPELSEGRRG